MGSLNTSSPTLPPAGIVPDGDTDRGVLLGKLVVAAHESRKTQAHTADEVLRIAGVVGRTAAMVEDLGTEVRGLRGDVRDLRAGERDLRKTDAEITQQIKAVRPEAETDWAKVGKIVGGIIFAILGGVGWLV